MSSSWSDEDLVRRCRQGEQQAWTELVRRTGKLVYGAVYGAFGKCGYSARADLADDVYCRVFAECWEKDRLASLKDPSALRAFLSAFAAARAVDAVRAEIRRTRRAPALGEAAAEAAGDGRPGPDDEARRREAERIVAEEVAALPVKEAWMLRLSVQHDLTHEEIAALARIPRDTVSTVIRRAKERIRESLRRKGIAEC